jgi:hypothetical protein
VSAGAPFSPDNETLTIRYPQMNYMARWTLLVGVVLAASLCRGEGIATGLVAGEASGRVLVREGGAGAYRGRATEGMELRAGEAVLTGPGSRVEWRVGERGRWRVGERAVWIVGTRPDEVELRAGTALAAVPTGARWTVGAARARVTLDEGVWLLTAVENEGLKVVALDEGVVEAGGARENRETNADAGNGVSPKVRMRAGEVVFVQPEGRGIGPIVTIFLDELLGSSRLITRFKEPLPQMERLRQQGQAQRERLHLVSNVHVGGAKDSAGFQLLVPGKAGDDATAGR